MREVFRSGRARVNGQASSGGGFFLFSRARCWAFLCLALTSGMAEGELSALRFDDFDLEAPIPVVRITKALALEGDSG